MTIRLHCTDDLKIWNISQTNKLANKYADILLTSYICKQLQQKCNGVPVLWNMVYIMSEPERDQGVHFFIKHKSIVV